MDAIDKLIQLKSLQSSLKIKITYIESSVSLDLVSIYFIGFVPSEDVLVPFRKFLSIMGFQELTGPFKPANEKALFLPKGWTSLEVTSALKEEWEKQGFDVEVKPDNHLM